MANRVAVQCDQCGASDSDPKLHYGARTYHHDCVPFWVERDLTEPGYYNTDGAWVADVNGEEWTDDTKATVKRVQAVLKKAKELPPVSDDPERGQKLLAAIQKINKEN